MCPRRSFSIHQGFFVAAYSTKTILFCWSILDGTFAKNGRNNDNLIYLFCAHPAHRLSFIIGTFARPFVQVFFSRYTNERDAYIAATLRQCARKSRMLVDVRVAASKVAEWRREQRGKRAAIAAVITSAAREAEEGRRQKSTRRATITAVITGAAKEAEEGRRQKSTKRATITAAIREDACLLYTSPSPRD